MSCVSKLSSALKWGTCTHLLVTLTFKETCKDTQYEGFTDKKEVGRFHNAEEIYFLAKVTFDEISCQNSEATVKHNLLFFLFSLEVNTVSWFVWAVNVLINVLKLYLYRVSFILCYLQGSHGYKK